MTNSQHSILAHASLRCAVCHRPWRELLEEQSDVEAVSHLATHGQREVAFALLVAEGHRLLAQHAHALVGPRIRELTNHLESVADQQRPAVTGGDGF